MSIWITVKGEKRLLDEAVKEEIIAMEEEFWERFEKVAALYEPEFIKRGLELTKERAWFTRENRKVTKHSRRPPIEEGYDYVCEYRVKKAGKVLRNLKEGDSTETWISRTDIVLPGKIKKWLYKKGIVKDLHLFLVEPEPEWLHYFVEDGLDDWIPCIDIGYYSPDDGEE